MSTWLVPVLWLALGCALEIRGLDVHRGRDRRDRRDRRDSGRDDSDLNPSEISVVLPETRSITGLPVVVLNALHHFPQLRVQILHGEENQQFLREEPTLRELREAGALVLTPMPEPYFYQNLNQSLYSEMLEQPAFWELVQTPKALLIQADTWICNGARSLLPEFLDNEYIGAPWKHPVPPCPNGVGNGGFSLRDIRAMLRITKGSRPDQLPEDVYFCSRVFPMPTQEEASRFARETLAEEDVLPDRLVGVHKGKAEWKNPAIEGLCPGVHLMLELNDKTDAAPYAASELAVRRWSREVTPHIVALVNAMPVGPAFAAVDLSMLRAHSNA